MSVEQARDQSAFHHVMGGERLSDVDLPLLARYRSQMNILRALTSVPERLYLLIIFLVVLTVADQPLGRYGFLPLPPTAFSILALLPFFILAVIQDMGARSLRRTVGPIILNRVPLITFFTLVIASFIGSLFGDAYWHEEGKWIFLIGYGFILSLLALYLPRTPRFITSLQNGGILALLLVGWSIYLDILTPGTFAEVTERAAGFSGNANYSALISVMITAAILDYQDTRARWFNPLVLTLCAAIVTTTMSRSGMVCFAILVFSFLALRLQSGARAASELRQLALTLACVFGVSCGAIAVVAAINPLGFQQTRLYRLTNSKRVDDGSAASRLFAAREALKRINESPILGKGTGYARTLPELPHNLYLQQWVNNGLPGLVGYLVFLGASYATFARRRFQPGQGLMVVVATGSFFSHNILDQRTFLVLYGSLLAFSACYARPAIPKYSVVA